MALIAPRAMCHEIGTDGLQLAQPVGRRLVKRNSGDLGVEPKVGDRCVGQDIGERLVHLCRRDDKGKHPLSSNRVDHGWHDETMGQLQQGSGAAARW